MIGPRVTLRGTSRLEVGKNLNIERDVELNTMARNGVVLGDNVTIKRGTIIECAAVLRSLGDRLVVGDRVGFSPYCLFAFVVQSRSGAIQSSAQALCSIRRIIYLMTLKQQSLLKESSRLVLQSAKDVGSRARLQFLMA